MTREKLVEIIKSTPNRDGVTEYTAIADTILAALEAERVGEVVLATGDIKPAFDSYDEHIGEYVGSVFIEGISEKLEGKRGQLIFREQEGK